MPRFVQGMYEVRDNLRPNVPIPNRQKRKTRHQAGFVLSLTDESVIFVSVFVLMLVAVSRMRTATATVSAHVVSEGTACCTAKACANGRTGGPTEAITDH